MNCVKCVSGGNKRHSAADGGRKSALVRPSDWADNSCAVWVASVTRHSNITPPPLLAPFKHAYIVLLLHSELTLTKNKSQKTHNDNNNNHNAHAVRVSGTGSPYHLTVISTFLSRHKGLTPVQRVEALVSRGRRSRKFLRIFLFGL